MIADGFPGVDEWWQQSITVEYEHTHGKRKKHETAGGFQISKSITIPVTIQQMYQAWVDENIRRQWLPDADFTVRKATEIKSMRITWVDGVTHVDVYFYEKKSGNQVTINHKKITDSETASAMKTYWEKAFQSLKINLAE